MIASTVGRTSVGASWQTMSNGPLYLVPVTIPGDRLFANIACYIRHQVANVPNVGGYVYADNSGAPGDVMAFTGQDGTAVLGTGAGRWFHFPVGMWVASSTSVWIGLSRTTGGGSWDLAYDSTGGSGGSLASPSDSAAWTPGTNDWSIHAVLLS